MPFGGSTVEHTRQGSRHRADALEEDRKTMSTRKNRIDELLKALALTLVTGVATIAGVSRAEAISTCCFPDGTCESNLSQPDCIAAGGAYAEGITCELHPCPPIGACCYHTGTCAITSQPRCVNTGGEWQGQGTTCATGCQGGSIGACCFQDGSCQDLTQEQCVAAGGQFNSGVTCALHPCPPPPPELGACCFEDGSCQDLTEEQCVAAGGQFNSGVTCDLHPCPPPPGEEACPRTVGFWGQQCSCSQGEGGPVKFSCSEMDAITACIETKSSFFAGAWGDPRAGFCATVNVARPIDQRKQAKRQFAALLANVCTGELAILANNGDVVSLPEDSEIDACSGFSADTIGELIDEVDDLLSSLEGQPMTDPVKAQYGQIIACTDRINNGGGGIPSCESNGVDTDAAAAAKSAVHNTTWGGVKGIYR